MRRDTRRKAISPKWWEDKKIVIVASGIILVIAIFIVALVNQGGKANKSDTSPNQIISLVPEEEIEGNTESASSSIGNKAGENVTAQNNINTNVENNTSNTTNTSVTNTTSAKENAEKIMQNKNVSQTKAEEEDESKTTPTNAKEDKNEKTSFEWPVKGDILKTFSIDNLLYSSTLQEWTVHNGIDIKADKASVVSAAEDGTVKSIKNDPRYGLTIVIEHSNGYKTVYSNLLTAEFVVEGEKVSKGQNIGTVGNSANFEVADDFHLHFEIMKDDECVDPMIYLK